MKNFRKYFYRVIAIIICLFAFGFYHSIHISYGKGKFDNGILSSKIIFYKNDFFRALKKWKDADFKNFTNKQYDEAKLQYLQSHLTVKSINGKSFKLQMTGNGEDASSIWFKVKFQIPDNIKKIEIKYTPLLKVFSGQMNLLNIKTASGEKSLIFSDSKKEINVKF